MTEEQTMEQIKERLRNGEIITIKHFKNTVQCSQKNNYGIIKKKRTCLFVELNKLYEIINIFQDFIIN